MKDYQNLHKVTTKGQITLPKKIREKLNIKPGDYVLIIQVGEEVVLSKKISSRSLVFQEKTADYQSFLDEKNKEKHLTTNLKEIYDQAIILEEKDRILLIKYLLESIERLEEQPSYHDLLLLEGIGQGLWGTKKEIDQHIEEERSSWEN